MNVSSSITPLIGERLADSRPNLQWIDINWEKVEEYVNRLQTGITKAAIERKLLPDTERVVRCLSGMKGNFHVPFLDEEG